MANEDIVVSIGADVSRFQRGVTKARLEAEKELRNIKATVKAELSVQQLETQFKDARKAFFENIQKSAGQIKFDTIGNNLYETLSSAVDRFYAQRGNSLITKPGRDPQTGQFSRVTDVQLGDKEQQNEIFKSMQARYAKEDQLRAGAIEGERNLAQQRIDINRYEQQEIVRSMRLRYAAMDEAARRENEATQEHINSLPRLRYALYDVANSMNVFSQATLGYATTSVQAFANYESAFTSVERTTAGVDMTTDKLNNLRNELRNLATTIPVTFEEITKIATLGGQLGIAAGDIAEFTDTVAKFAATTNVNAESAAQSFGALGQLLDVAASDYDKLGSAIAYAGVNAVATESEILSVATAIAGVANNADISAEYTLALSTSLASLRVPAEQSRGALTRVFQEISRSAQTGGAAMQEFARLTNMSVKDATSLAGSDMETFFTKFLQGLSSLDTSGLTASLDQLNLSDIRVTNTLARLSNNLQLVEGDLSNVQKAYGEGTFLTEAFGSKADDLNSKLQILSNVFSELQASIGAGLGEAIKPAVDYLTQLLKALTAIAKNPVGNVIIGLGVAMAGILGAIGAVASMLAVGAASMLAFRTAVFAAGEQAGIQSTKLWMFSKALSDIPFHANGAIAGLRQFSAETLKATLTMGNLAKAGTSLLKGFGWTALISIGLDLVSKGFTALQEAMKSTEEKGKDFIGSMEGLNEAIQKDKVNTTDAADIKGVYTKALDGSTIAIGKNTAELLTNTLMQDENIKKILKNAEDIKKAGGPILDTPKFIAMYVKGDTDAALKYLSEYYAEVNKLKNLNKDTGPGNVGSVNTTGQLTGGLINMQQQARPQFSQDISAGVDSMEAARKAADGMKAALESAGVSGSTLSNVMKELGYPVDEVSTSADRMKTAFAKAFGVTEDAAKASADFTSALSSLSNSLETNGTSFDKMTSGGIANLAALSNAIQSSIAAAEKLGISAAGAIGQVFANLQAQGIETAQLLQQVASMGSVQAQAVSSITTAQSGVYAGLTTAYNAMKSGASGAGKAAGGAAKQVKTLNDYANELANVFKRAFDIRFSAAADLDKITKGFRSIADSIADARLEIDSLNADISQLTADKALQEYFLSVANAYGDTLSAGQINADLAKINADLAAKNKSLAKAQDKTNKTLVGNSDAAIDNRAEIVGLVGDYQDYIQSLASSGASQDTLRAAVQQSRADFMAQATQLGYNSDELQTYAAAFNDVTVAINNVPRDITVEANVDPAIQAMNELKAKADAAAASRTLEVGVSVDYGAMAKFARGAALLAEITKLEKEMAAVSMWDDVDAALTVIGGYYQPKINDIKNRLNSGNFASGGYTGAGGKYEVAGIVHRGEYVVPKEQVNQSTGLPYYMQQPRTFAQGGYASSAASTMMVSLSPEDRAILRSAGGTGEVVLYANNVELARSVNDGNRTIVAQGGRP